MPLSDALDSRQPNDGPVETEQKNDERVYVAQLMLKMHPMHVEIYCNLELLLILHSAPD